MVHLNTSGEPDDDDYHHGGALIWAVNYMPRRFNGPTAGEDKLQTILLAQPERAST